MKQCNKCKKFKELHEFHRNKRNVDELSRECKVCATDRAKIHYENNKKEKLIYQREYSIRNKEKVSNLKKIYYRENKQYLSEYIKLYAEKHRNVRNHRESLRRKTDNLYRLSINLRNRIRKFFIGLNRSKSTSDILGCSLEHVKFHLESLFQPGMTWENYGEWHIDHKYPLSMAKSEEELEKLCHYTNLQPLWASDNIKKSNKVM